MAYQQEHKVHLAWLSNQEQQYCKIGVPITILNKSINAHAELITNSIFSQQGIICYRLTTPILLVSKV